MIKISNICLNQNSIFIKFLKILKIYVFFCENPRIFLFCFRKYTKRTCSQLIQKMGAKRPIRLVSINFITPRIFFCLFLFYNIIEQKMSAKRLTNLLFFIYILVADVSGVANAFLQVLISVVVYSPVVYSVEGFAKPYFYFRHSISNHLLRRIYFSLI